MKPARTTFQAGAMPLNARCDEGGTEGFFFACISGKLCLSDMSRIEVDLVAVVGSGGRNF